MGVKVSDGKNISDEFRLSILITPVNDPPEITVFDTTRLKYEPDADPINVLDSFDLRDVDGGLFEQVNVIAYLGVGREQKRLSAAFDAVTGKRDQQ